MARVLTMMERTVEATARTAYLLDVRAKQRRADLAGVHFWVFENDDELGRFVEFTEGADATAVAQWHDGELTTPIWREV